MEEAIDFNEQFSRALHLLQNGSNNVFVTGKAGTGKSTLLRYFRAHTDKKIVVLAPTGVAALNVGGETVHSFFRFAPGTTPGTVRRARREDADTYRGLDAIVIDEASMLRADLLDCIDAFMRLNGREPGRPFGGAQLLLFGDLYQLPPVVTEGERELFSSLYKGPYFFNARVFGEAGLEYVELEKIYRQRDQGFIDILNAIRNNSVSQAQLDALNSRVGADVEGERRGAVVRLTATNADAAEVNHDRLSRLDGRDHVYRAKVKGDFGPDAYPADAELRLKAGAQVMLLNNDPGGRWVNGTMAVVADIMRGAPGEDDIVHVRLPDGLVEPVPPYEWELFHFSCDGGAMRSETVGTFRQYPLKLAWGVTIHKGQGKTFDRAVIDLGRGAFAPGQSYVALSRCASLEGLSLARPVRASDVRADRRVVRYVTSRQYGASEQAMPLEEKIRVIELAIAEGRCLEITYLKAADEKSRRRVRPISVGDRRYNTSRFKGLEAECLLRGGRRMFRVDRILELRPVAA